MRQKTWLKSSRWRARPARLRSGSTTTALCALRHLTLSAPRSDDIGMLGSRASDDAPRQFAGCLPALHHQLTVDQDVNNPGGGYATVLPGTSVGQSGRIENGHIRGSARLKTAPIP